MTPPARPLRNAGCAAALLFSLLFSPPAVHARTDFIGEARGLLFEPTSDALSAQRNRSAEGELRYRGAYDTLRLGAELDTGMARTENGAREHWSLREGFASWHSEPMSVLLGRKLESWGISEFFSPTDVLAPVNLARHRVDEKKRNLGTDQASLEWNAGDSTKLRAIVMPYRESAVLPSALTGLLAASNGGAPVSVPERRHRVQSALRAEHRSEGFDASLMAFDGNEQLPVFAVAADGRLHGRLPRQQVVGGDVVVSALGVLWQAEAAWWRSAAFCGDGARCGTDESQHLVLGIEKQMAGDVYLTAQWWHRWTRYAARNEPGAWSAELAKAVRNQFDRQLDVLFANVSTPFWNDRARWDIGGGLDTTRASRYFRTKLDVSFDDHWKLRMKFEHFHGGPRELFGLLRYNSGATVELAYLFNASLSNQSRSLANEQMR